MTVDTDLISTKIFPIDEAFPGGSWNEFLMGFPEQATVFHTREWMKTFEDAFGYQAMCMLAMGEDGGNCYAALPFMLNEKLGTSNWLSMPFDTYGGPIGEPEYLQPLLHRFLASPCFGVKRCTDFYGDSTSKENIMVSTEIADISQSLNCLWEHMHKDNRTAIRSAWNHYISAEISAESFGDYRDVPRPLLEAILTNMIPSGHGAQIIAKLGEEVVAKSLFFFYGNMAFYWANHVTATGRKTNANYLLMWEAIRYAKERGCTMMNFGASPEGADSLVRFKKSWGTKTWPYVLEQRIPFELYPFFAVWRIFHG